ncbi:MAG: YebC/PmpR family DNA-binding transcriptional regulator [Phycisphaerales bacterium]
MAGHNKWSKVKHRKAVLDKRRSKVWSKVSRAMIVAARHGGADPDSNLALRYAIDEARYANMPRDTIERAIQKGAFGSDTENYENMRYECYGPGGVAIIVDALTNNRTRTITDLRNAFNDYGGNVGSTGCVAYMFQPKGQVLVDGKELKEDRVMQIAIDAGAIDVRPPDDEEEPVWTLISEVHDFAKFKAAIEAAKLPIIESGLVMIPDTSSVLAGEHAKNFLALVDTLEDLDDVQKVWSNAQISGEVE